MKTEFKPYRFHKFPITFVYPAYARYRRYHEKKHSKQVIIRSEKESYGRRESGKVFFIYPKLCITVQRVYVPAYQTSNRQAYFMPFDKMLRMVIQLDRKKSAFPEMICENIVMANFWQGVSTTYRHPNSTYWRTEIYLHEMRDDTNMVDIMYRHIGRGRSDDELDIILDSFKPVPIRD